MTERLAANFSDIKLTRVFYPNWTYPFGADALVNFFREHYGPVKRAFGVLNEKDQAKFHRELAENFEAHNAGTNDALDFRGEFLNVTAKRK